MINSSAIFNQISLKLSQETDLQNQLAIVVAGAMDLTRSDAGTLYSLQEDKSLKFEVVLNRSLEINKKAPDIDFANIPVYREGSLNASMVVVNCVLKEETITVDDVYKEESYNFSGTRVFDETTGYRTHSVLTVPIFDFEKKIIGVIQLINAMDSNGEIRTFNENDRDMVNLFILQTAFTMSSKLLIDKQRMLMESLKST